MTDVPHDGSVEQYFGGMRCNRMLQADPEGRSSNEANTAVRH
jgi:hypothetical protein